MSCNVIVTLFMQIMNQKLMALSLIQSWSTCLRCIPSVSSRTKDDEERGEDKVRSIEMPL